MRWHCLLPRRAQLCQVERVPNITLVGHGERAARELIESRPDPVAVRALAEACASAGAPSVRAESHARLTCRARVPSFAGAGEWEELSGTSFPHSWTRRGRFSYRWLRKVRAGPKAHLAPHARLTHRARSSRPPFGACAPRSASHPKRCPDKVAHARSRPTRVQLKDTAIWTASLAKLVLEVLLHAGFLSWRSGTQERCRAARGPSVPVGSVVDSTVG